MISRNDVKHFDFGLINHERLRARWAIELEVERRSGDNIAHLIISDAVESLIAFNWSFIEVMWNADVHLCNYFIVSTMSPTARSLNVVFSTRLDTMMNSMQLASWKIRWKILRKTCEINVALDVWNVELSSYEFLWIIIGRNIFWDNNEREMSSWLWDALTSFLPN